MRTINGNAMQAAGKNPAMNKAATDRLVRFANTTMGMHGGTSIPIADAEATIDTACSGRYPPRFIAGMRIEPIAETSATDAPETPEKMYSPRTVEIPRLPRT